MAVIFAIGKYGGFYWFNGFTKKLCLGWIGITFVPGDIDDFLEHWLVVAPRVEKSQPPNTVDQPAVMTFTQSEVFVERPIEKLKFVAYGGGGAGTTGKQEEGQSDEGGQNG